MANRYLVGSGAFTSTSIWSTTYGGSSGASAPVSGDIIYVDNNYNITSGLPTTGSFDLIIRLGANTASGVTLGLSGSPTFRLLDIRSANSSAHTVNFDASSTTTVDKLVVVGAGTAYDKKISLNAPSSYSTIAFTSNGTSYGYGVAILYMRPSGITSPYIGSGSTYIGESGGWLYSDPPKISTLVDPLTTAPGSNTNWTVSGTVTAVTSGHDGGGYQLASGATITSTDTFDIVDNYIIVEARSLLYENVYLYLEIDGITFKSLNNSIGTANLYLRYKANSATNTIDVDYSTNAGLSWTSYSSDTFYNEINQYRSVRLGFESYAGPTTIGSINPSLISAPTVTTGAATSLTDTTVTIAGNVTSDGGDTVTERGIVYNTSTNPTTANSKATTTGTTGAFTKGLTGLTTKTTYYARAYAINSVGTSYGSNVSFTMKGVPVADFTESATNVKVGTAINFTDTSTYEPTSWLWTFNDATTSTTKNPSKSYSTNGVYTVSLKATNAYGDNTKTKTSLLTIYDTPTLTSSAPDTITWKAAKVYGNVTADRNSTITERGFVYATTASPTTSNTKSIVAGTTGAFNATLTGLTNNRKYYVRPYAINAAGTAYGAEQDFTTQTIPSATTGTAGTPALTTVTITGNAVTNPDSLTLTEYGVAYATTTSPVITDSKKTSTDSIANYPAALTGLTEGTTYYARAYVTFDGSTYYGSQISFKTTGRPIITINSPANNGTTGDLSPKLEFTGNDSDNDRIQYQVQFNTSNSFTSPAIDVTSGTDSGFTNQDTPADTSPYLNNNKIRYTLAGTYSRGSSYYWRVRGKDPSGSNTWGDWTSSTKFTIDTVAPTISITGFSDINDTNLKITADITSDGGATVTERGVCWSLTANPTTADSKATGSGNPFTVTATGLTASTVYNFRAYATNAKGTSYSNNITQQSEQPEKEPTVTTADATGIYYTNASVGGEVTLDGRHTVTERGVVFGTSSNPTIADRKFTAPTAGLGTFNGGITGLDPDTTYHMRAYAINSQGAGYGADKTFTTLALPANEDDGYWVFSNTGSTAVVARTQATPKNSSADLYIEPFLTVGKTYTLHVGNISADAGTPKLVLEYIDGTLQSFTIAQNTAKTFTYSGTTSLVRLRLYVTAGSTVAGELTATFEDMYLAEEGSFSSFVPFERRGAKEIKIINNQILDKRREDVLPTLYSKLLGLRYTPFDITTEGLGYFEIYDGFKIKDPNDDEITVLMTDKKLTLDGGIQEKLQGKTPDKTETDYSKAGGITKLLSQTTLQVDKQAGNIEALVSDVYDNDGYIENKFSQVYQDVNQVKTTVQGAGGVNLVRNSAMFAYNNLGYPDSWTTTVGGSGTITIQGDPESRNAGAIAGNSFTLKDATVKQTVTVRKDADFIAADQKTYYAFNAKVKKNLVGDAYIKLFNRNETHQIDLESGTAYFWEDITFESLLPLDDYYTIEIYSDTDAKLQVTDIILSVGEFRHEWTPSAGELGNASVSITEDGMTIRQAQFKYNYLKLDALGIEVNQKVIGQDWQIFGFNGAETNTYQLKTEKQFTMGSMRILPIDDGAGLTGWAFTPKEGA